ncbi:pyridoxal phosphate-dependent aminotransferase [Roseivirga sp. E12]|uniref:pyridoxal phosphate-dependent aminotransferase n=1 Tax=Roseivirga sp. E12 TaxID=2819237 RepID=UPI001ABBFA14|nr:pyridoxal phosphate-dependent aminotransferase [Roseivirga sp. E12]MBO3699589.1 pyridoxal phosphate-dependent aminotransferase [Roseivirga sp. E12]
MEMLSDRIKNMAESATLAMAAKAREYKARGINVISLSLGEPDFKTPKHIQQGAKDAIDEEKYFAYPPVNGYLDVRQAISEKFKRENDLEYSADQIVISNGAKQSIANVFQALINEGDEVVVFAPFWVSYSALIELAGGVPVYVNGGIESDFKVTADQLAAAITPKTKALIFSSPCNPTGSVFTKEELLELSEVILGHENLVVIADEIYEHINYTGAHASIGALPGMIDRTVTVNGMAKGFAMTGWRVGYIGAPLWLARACNKVQGQFTSANCGIAQRAAYTALTSDLGPTREMAKEYLRRRDLVKDLLDSIPGFKTNLPQGAFYFFPDISAYFGKSDGETSINNASDLSMFILDHAQVSVVTGEAFGDPSCIRLSYAASEEDLREAIRRIKEALAKLS